MDDATPLTVSQVATRRRVSTDTVLEWIHSGALVATDIGTGGKRATWQIEPDDLKAFLASRRNVKPRPEARRAGRQPAGPEVTRYFA